MRECKRTGILQKRRNCKVNPRTKYLLHVGLFLLACAAQAHAQSAARQLTPAQALNVRSISDLHYSPDGEVLACVVTEPVKGTTRARHIWLLNVKTQELRQFTNSPKSEDSPRWSPDGKQLAFLSNRDDSRQLYVISPGGGEAKRLVETKQEIQSFSWSSNGKQIAYLASEPKTDAEDKKEKDKDDARVVDRDDKLTRLWVLDVESSRSRQLTSGKWRTEEAEWAPEGDRLIVSATDHPESDQETNRIYSVNVADGKVAEVAAPRGPFGHLRVSPDGKSVAYLAAKVDGPQPHDLFVCSLSAADSHNLTGVTLDRPVNSFLWTTDKSFTAVIQNGFKTNFVSIGTGGEVKPSSTLAVNPRAFDLSGRGQLAFVAGNATEPEEIWLQIGNQAPQRASDFNKSWQQFKLQPAEVLHFKSFDGQEIEGTLIKPQTYQQGTRAPLVVLVHGGPTGAWSDSIESWGQLLAAHGFVVFYPNVRGSTGYGQRFIEMNRADWGGGDFRDVMAGVDFLIKQNIADPQRLGIGGWSYGGYMAEWAITQTNRFKAAVSGAGLSNLASEFGTENGSSYDQWFYGVPYENLDGFMKSSPVKYLKNAHTPTLILQGEADTTDPLGQSQELYRGLKYYGVEAEMVVYPREGHGLREEKHLLDRLNRIVAWYEKHLQ
jgi:dipeptidyl aminopeptidase/acylaminoacyl peptidase